MAREYLELGTCPVNAEEDCPQVGEDDQLDLMVWARAWRNQLARAFPDAADRLKIKAFPHDFGRYYEVVIYYGSDYEGEQAFAIEGSLPEDWDVLALEEIIEYSA